jgi:hypothetical protein
VVWLLLSGFVAFSVAALVAVLRATREMVTCPYCRRETPAALRSPSHAPALDDKEYCRYCHRRFERGTPLEEDSMPRFLTESGPQLAGKACVVCRQKISIAWTASICRACNEPVHLECLPHRHNGNQNPYRS